jgi:hypothetical protein
MEVSGQTHAKATLPAWTEAAVPTEKKGWVEPGAALSVFGKKNNLLPLAGSEFRTVQPVDWSL